MIRPKICFLHPTHADGIWGYYRTKFGDLGFDHVGYDQADILCFTAGEPFWTDNRYRDYIIDYALNSTVKVMIVDKHEYGWMNYTEEQRRCNAWLGTGSYGVNTVVAGANHREHNSSLIRLCENIDHDRLIYFRREYFRDVNYPSFIHPTNFAITCIPHVVSYEEFSSRPFDIMCAWGETHVHRQIIGSALKMMVADKTISGDIRSPVYVGDPGRIPPESYRQTHASARLFMTADGNGCGGGREWDLITTSAMIRKRSWMVLPHEFVHGETCLEFGTPDDPRPDELKEILAEWKDRKRELYDIYLAGHEHASKYHTIDARCAFAIERMKWRGWIF